MRRTALLLAATLLAHPAAAEVAGFELTARAPALGGRSFGAAGTAEMITGRATLALDPTLPQNMTIVDLDQAPRDAKGRVGASTDVVILRPARPNGTLLFEVLNRGRKLIPGWAQDTQAAQGVRLQQPEDAGNGFLLEQGFTLVWAAWQGDTPRAANTPGLDLPIAAGLTGFSREELTFDGTSGPKRATLAYPAADPARARLVMRTSADAPPTTPAGLGYVFIDPSTIEVTPPENASAAALYEFSYQARDPKPFGIGLAAIRDVTSFLRFDTTAANPLADNRPARAIGLGISQSGRVLRDYLYYGLNQDEQGRTVFDGLMPIIPGARRSFTNARFAQPGRNPGPQFDRLFPVLQFPFTYPVTTDPVSGKRDGILLRCSTTNTCPRIIQADSEFEFWGSQASLLTTDGAGHPIEMPDSVRLFLFAGTPHGNVFDAVSTTRADCALPLNPNNGAPTIRALLVAMQRWVAEGVPPPPSRYPDRAQGTLVPAAEAYLPTPALGFREQLMLATWHEQTPQGPIIRGQYKLFVPRTGPDGNAVAGVRLPIVAAPRATYTGWNPVRGLSGPQDLCTQMGAAIPLPATADPTDPRPALNTLYPTQDAYVAAVRAAAEDLVAARLLLPADADAAVNAARGGVLDKLRGR